jgi:hypothetical protein
VRHPLFLPRRAACLAGWLAAAAAGPLAPSLSAQVEVTPFVASFYAMTTLNEQQDVPLPSFAGTPPGTITRQQEDAPALGARVSFPLSGVIRVEGEFGLAFSDASVSQIPRDNAAAGLTFRQNAQAYFGSVRAVLRPRRQNFFGILGAGIVARGGEAWENVDQSAKAAGVVGFGVRAAVNPKLSLTFSAETYLYSFSFTSGQVPNSESKLQADLIVAIGVPIGTR